MTDGSPLGGDAIGYAAWKTAAGIASDATDGDADGLLPLVEYACGSDPALPSLDLLPTVERNALGEWIITITRALSADDADFSIQTSSDATNWTNASIVIDSRVVAGSREVFTCRLSSPPASRFFLRSLWSLRP